jgi:hypothetical protein
MLEKVMHQGCNNYNDDEDHWNHGNLALTQEGKKRLFLEGQRLALIIKRR